MPSSMLNDQVIYSLLCPTYPLYVVSPRLFRCTHFVHGLSSGRDKMYASAIKCVFLGYSRVQKFNRSTCNLYPIYNCMSYHLLSPTHCAFVTELAFVYISKTIQEALSHPGRRQTILDEMSALESNHTWELVPLSYGKSVVGCRRIFNVKVGRN